MAETPSAHQPQAYHPTQDAFRGTLTWEAPNQWNEWSKWLAAGLHARNRWRLPVLLVGILFATGRRTVTTWLQAAGVSCDFQNY